MEASKIRKILVQHNFEVAEAAMLEQITEAEAALGFALPESLKEFFLATNSSRLPARDKYSNDLGFLDLGIFQDGDLGVYFEDGGRENEDISKFIKCYLPFFEGYDFQNHFVILLDEEFVGVVGFRSHEDLCHVEPCFENLEEFMQGYLPCFSDDGFTTHDQFPKPTSEIDFKRALAAKQKMLNAEDMDFFWYYWTLMERFCPDDRVDMFEDLLNNSDKVLELLTRIVHTADEGKYGANTPEDVLEWQKDSLITRIQGAKERNASV